MSTSGIPIPTAAKKANSWNTPRSFGFTRGGAAAMAEPSTGDSVSRRGIEEVRLVAVRAQRDPRATLGSALRIDPRDQLPDLGGREHVGVGADLLDDLHLARDAVGAELERLRPQADDHLSGLHSRREP